MAHAHAPPRRCSIGRSSTPSLVLGGWCSAIVCSATWPETAGPCLPARRSVIASAPLHPAPRAHARHAPPGEKNADRRLKRGRLNGVHKKAYTANACPSRNGSSAARFFVRQFQGPSPHGKETVSGAPPLATRTRSKDEHREKDPGSSSFRQRPVRAAVIPSSAPQLCSCRRSSRSRAICRWSRGDRRVFRRPAIVSPATCRCLAPIAAHAHTPATTRGGSRWSRCWAERIRANNGLKCRGKAADHLTLGGTTGVKGLRSHHRPRTSAGSPLGARCGRKYNGHDERPRSALVPATAPQHRLRSTCAHFAAGGEASCRVFVLRRTISSQME